MTPEYALPIAVAALMATALAVPYAVGLIRRSARRE
jgi:hypothetical protein